MRRGRGYFVTDAILDEQSRAFVSGISVWVGEGVLFGGEDTLTSQYSLVFSAMKLVRGTSPPRARARLVAVDAPVNQGDRTLEEF